MDKEQQKEIAELAAIAAVEAHCEAEKRQTSPFDKVKQTLANMGVSALAAAVAFMLMSWFKENKDDASMAKDQSASAIAASDEAIIIATGAVDSTKRTAISLQVVQDRVAIMEAELSESMVPRAKPVTVEDVNAKKEEILKAQDKALYRAPE